MKYKRLRSDEFDGDASAIRKGVPSSLENIHQ